LAYTWKSQSQYTIQIPFLFQHYSQ
jgi:hypothetical protein